jgi:exopolyphosphatase/guanosine-5'-triphosphate,3'-diphosphate pyrophosphatase
MEQSVQSQQMLAAIDLGSNSFHMVLARLLNGQVQVIDERGEKVQLAAGLSPINGIAEDAQERALACLERFAQQLKGLEPQNVAVLGTNTLRAARNSYAFMQKANKVLGFPIEIISGVEEARLVYLGVAHTLADDDGKRLVIDIGGGSTEFIIGERFAPLKLESLHMGCVSYTDRYFADGQLTEAAFSRAIAAVKSELMSIKSAYQHLGWQNVVGSSGTARATSRVLEGYSLSEKGINLPALLELKKIVIRSKHVDKLKLQGIKDQRLKVFPAGLAILIGIFESLDIDHMEYCGGALREGALHDLLGRAHHEDVREKTVIAMQQRYSVDAKHAIKVRASANHFFFQVNDQWKLNQAEHLNWLNWTADLHEVGLVVAHTQFHKHGAYLLKHGDMPGFTKPVQEVLAMIVRSHRRKLPVYEIETEAKIKRKTLLRLAIILRLSVLLHHDRGQDRVVLPAMDVEKAKIQLIFPDEYLDKHPMTVLDLEREKGWLKDAGFELSFR